MRLTELEGKEGKKEEERQKFGDRQTKNQLVKNEVFYVTEEF